jgi:hypothetical protein
MFARLNLAAGVLHLILFVIIAVTNTVMTSRGRSIFQLRFTATSPTVPERPVACSSFEDGCTCTTSDTSLFCDVLSQFSDETDPERQLQIARNALYKEKQSFTLQLAWVVAAFPLITMFFHFYLGSPWGQPAYKANLALQRNPFRWVEYSITASIMLTAIAGLSDVREVDVHLGIFGLMMGLNILGLGVEDALASGRKYTAIIMFNAATIMLLIAFYPILNGFRKFQKLTKDRSGDLSAFYTTFFGDSPIGENIKDGGKFEIPSFVTYAVYGIFLLYFIYPILLLLRWAGVLSYGGGEKAFIIASFTAKAFLVIAVASGIAREDPPEYLSKDPTDGG